ncbi:MAG: stage II sporulation protein P [Oscillospiraceae bacterium]|nr:stage II sporulation protein P [Oscillospiraceae bacterium]
MNKQLNRITLLCATACVMLCGYRTIPKMQNIQIGIRQLPASAVTVSEIQSPESTTAPQTETEIRETSGTEPELFAPPVQPKNHDYIINIESDGSKAMWHARLYQETKSGSGGEIVDRHFGSLSSTVFFDLPNGGQVRNTTSWNNSELLEESKKMPLLDLKTDGTPMVLIYHTHTTESYVSPKTGNYDADCTFRSTEPDKNMVMVGDAIAEQLAAAGIGVVHARELHDYPVWTGAYANSAVTVQNILAQYPSICIALDIHRDAISDGDTVIAPVTEIDGRQAAQIMIISGCDDGTMGMPNYRENFHFACRLQETAETMFPGFTRPILFDYRKYNQELTTGSLLIEVGSQGNTLEEARYAGELVGRSLSETIRLLASPPQ